MLRSVFGVSLLLSVGLFSAVGCGGATFDSRGAGGSAAAGTGSSVGGHSQAGGVGVGGSMSSAGSSSGGRASAGGTGNATGNGGAGNVTGIGGTGGGVTASGGSVTGIGGGVTGIGGSGAGNGGTGNATGIGGTGGGADVRACSSNSDCQLAAANCCSCGQGPVSEFTAINYRYQSQYEQRCGGLACAPCMTSSYDPNDAWHYYVPTCQAGRCAVIDLRSTDVTECATANDCTLRSGTSCCSGCSGPPVALNASRQPELSKLVCGTEPTACPACAPNLSGYTTQCSGGRCAVLITPCDAAQPCPL